MFACRALSRPRPTTRAREIARRPITSTWRREFRAAVRRDLAPASCSGRQWPRVSATTGPFLGERSRDEVRRADRKWRELRVDGVSGRRRELHRQRRAAGSGDASAAVHQRRRIHHDRTLRDGHSPIRRSVHRQPRSALRPRSRDQSRSRRARCPGPRNRCDHRRPRHAVHLERRLAAARLDGEAHRRRRNDPAGRASDAFTRGFSPASSHPSIQE